MPAKKGKNRTAPPCFSAALEYYRKHLPFASKILAGSKKFFTARFAENPGASAHRHAQELRRTSASEDEQQHQHDDRHGLNDHRHEESGRVARRRSARIIP